MKEFMDLFKFDVSKTLFVGVEREAFIINEKGDIIPQACAVLAHTLRKTGKKKGIVLETVSDERFGYELSSCQVETKVGPCVLEELFKELANAENDLNEYVRQALSALRMLIGLADWLGREVPDSIPEKMNLSYIEVGPEDMPLDVYPDPSGRYQQIVKTMPRDVLLAACRVIGTHVHIGMPDHETALRVYNRVIKNCALLCARGNGSFGERLDIYRIVAPDCDPQPYVNWEDFYRVAVTKGFDKDPRKCWTLIRISKHGTIEFRMFGATPSLERIVGWAKLCHDMCAEVML